MEGKGRTKGGGYGGGKHGALTKGETGTGLDSHHMPAQTSYPNKLSSKESNNSPAILMDHADHQATLSHHNGGVGAGARAKAYTSVQKMLMKNNLTVVAMAMDIADIKRIACSVGNCSKYDEAITQMVLWAICAGKI